MVKLSFDELKKLFDKFSLDSLESLYVLISESDIDVWSAYSNVYKKKFEPCRDEYEGINEYDYLCRLHNFCIKEIEDNIIAFTQKELKFLEFLLKNNGINDKNIFDTLLSNIFERNLEIFFNKYSFSELNSFKVILGYICDDYVTDVFKVFNKVFEKKSNDKFTDCNLLNILKKNNKLSDEEFLFLYKLVSDASCFLSSVQDYSYVYESMIDDFDINEYPILGMSKLENALCEELEKKNNGKFLEKNIL